jgi:hypothetical protein
MAQDVREFLVLFVAAHWKEQKQSQTTYKKMSEVNLINLCETVATFKIPLIF